MRTASMCASMCVCVCVCVRVRVFVDKCSNILCQHVPQYSLTLTENSECVCVCVTVQVCVLTKCLHVCVWTQAYV